MLTADPGTGVMRHADAGYELAIDTARERGVDLPMVTVTRAIEATTPLSGLPMNAPRSNIGQLATCRAEGGQGEIHAIADAALVWEGGEIRWVGPRRGAAGRVPTSAERLDAGGRLVIPGLVDCHTHLAFGGWRAEEFAQRIAGASYLEIARAGRRHRPTVRLDPRGRREAAADQRAPRLPRARCSRSASRRSSARAATASTASTSSGCCGCTAALAAERPAAARADLPRRARGAAGVPRPAQRATSSCWSSELIPEVGRRAAGPLL